MEYENHVVLSGEITGSVLKRITSRGREVVRFQILPERGSWIQAQAWGDDVRDVERAQEGMAVRIEGCLQHKRWKDDNGTWHSSVLVNIDRKFGGSVFIEGLPPRPEGLPKLTTRKGVQ